LWTFIIFSFLFLKEDVEYTNDTIFDPNVTTAIVNNSHSLILDSNCNSGSSTSGDDTHNLKVKRYKSDKAATACRLRLFIWFFAIVAAACIISVALYYFVRYGYEQGVYERVVATDMQLDAESMFF
jgi:hypothetical protein